MPLCHCIVCGKRSIRKHYLHITRLGFSIKVLVQYIFMINLNRFYKSILNILPKKLRTKSVVVSMKGKLTLFNTFHKILFFMLYIYGKCLYLSNISFDKRFRTREKTINNNLESSHHIQWLLPMCFSNRMSVYNRHMDRNWGD